MCTSIKWKILYKTCTRDRHLDHSVRQNLEWPTYHKSGHNKVRHTFQASLYSRLYFSSSTELKFPIFVALQSLKFGFRLTKISVFLLVYQIYHLSVLSPESSLLWFGPSVLVTQVTRQGNYAVAFSLFCLCTNKHCRSPKHLGTTVLSVT